MQFTHEIGITNKLQIKSVKSRLNFFFNNHHIEINKLNFAQDNILSVGKNFLSKTPNVSVSFD